MITFVLAFVHRRAARLVSTFFLCYARHRLRASAPPVWATGWGPARDRAGLAIWASIAALATVHSIVALAVVGVVFGTAQGIVYPTLNAFAIEHVPVGQLGRLQTLFNGAFNLGVTTGSFALGNVADAYGHRPAFVCAAATALVATALFAATTGDARR
jgi:predicted MFS family arabinose efflux permease